MELFSVNPTDKVAKDSQKFNANKSKWSNLKCLEIQDLIAAANRFPTATNHTLLEASAKLLCAGPKFSENQAELLTSYLQEMQYIFVGTQVCLPKKFDVCLNLDRIWEFTYVLRGANEIYTLNMDAVKPKM